LWIRKESDSFQVDGDFGNFAIGTSYYMKGSIMTKRFGLILVSALAIALVASIASAGTSTWIATSQVNWVQASASDRPWNTTSGACPWTTPLALDGTDNLVFTGSGASIWAQNAITVNSITSGTYTSSGSGNGGTIALNDTYCESGSNGAGLNPFGNPTNKSLSGLYGLTVVSGITLNGGLLETGEGGNNNYDGSASCPQLSFEANTNPTITLNNCGGMRICAGFRASSTTNITITGICPTYQAWWNANPCLEIDNYGNTPGSNSTIQGNFTLDDTGLALAPGVNSTGTLTVTANTTNNPGMLAFLSLGVNYAGSGVATQSGNIILQTGASLNLRRNDGAGDQNGLISGQISGDATSSINNVRGNNENGDNGSVITFAPVSGSNSTFLGMLNLGVDTNVFQGTWTNLGNITVNCGGYADFGTVSGNASLGMAPGASVTLTGAAGPSWSPSNKCGTIAPTGGTLTLGTEANNTAGNPNVVHFQNLSTLKLNLNDVKADGVTPVADSLAINGNLDLGTGTTTNVLNVVTTGLSPTTAYKLATFDSLTSVQQAFGSVVVNGTTLAGNGTAIGSFTSGETTLAGGTLYGGHHLVYTPGNGTAGSGSLVLAMELIPGDINADGLVDVADYDIWAANVGATNATWSQGDLNGDGLVDVADYDIWAANVGATAATPEPISMIILAIGGGLVALKRRNG
jgi:hypothetical protein